MTDNFVLKNINNKIGNYAISTIGFDSWADEPTTQIPIKGKKNKGAKDIVNKIFEESAKIIQDPFWIEKFNNAAINKFPQKFSFHGGVLSYKRGTKYISFEVPNNPYEAAYGCMEFFRVNGSIFSPMDQQNSINMQYIRASNAAALEPITWESANKKVRECLLSYYITDMKMLMNLRERESLQLKQTVKLAISGKFFDKNNITVLNDRIHSINGLLWDDKERKFYVDPNIKPSTTRSYARKKEGNSLTGQQKDTIPQFGVKWRKYLETIDKKMVRNERYKRCTVLDYPNNQEFINNHFTTTADTTSYTEDDERDCSATDDDRTTE